MQALYATAGRVSEILSLQRADVGEGHATQVEIVGKGGRRRAIFLTEPAQRAIQSYLSERTDSAPGLFVSHGANKERPLSPQSVWQIVNHAARGIFGVGPDGRPLRRVGPHSFRHLRAQHLSDERMPITSLQALLGHASISTTRDIYAPKTPAQALMDELSTFGRDPQRVIRDGEEAAEAIRRKRQAVYEE
jgi:integrase/recombinase XerD